MLPVISQFPFNGELDCESGVADVLLPQPMRPPSRGRKIQVTAIRSQFFIMQSMYWSRERMSLLLLRIPLQSRAPR